jgi:hypothetical protein
MVMQGSEAVPLASITFEQFKAWWDDPFNVTRSRAGDARARLIFQPEEWFGLWAEIGPKVFLVVNDDGQPLRFRTLDAAWEALGRAAGVHPEVRLNVPEDRPVRALLA